MQVFFWVLCDGGFAEHRNTIVFCTQAIPEAEKVRAGLDCHWLSRYPFHATVSSLCNRPKAAGNGALFLFKGSAPHISGHSIPTQVRLD